MQHLIYLLKFIHRTGHANAEKAPVEKVPASDDSIGDSIVGDAAWVGEIHLSRFLPGVRSSLRPGLQSLWQRFPQCTMSCQVYNIFINQLHLYLRERDLDLSK